MTDEELDALTAPDWYAPRPLAPDPGPGGMFLSQVDRPEHPHMCGKCRNPYTREGNPACPGRRAKS